MAGLTVVVIKTGPIFDGRAQQQVDRACDDIAGRVAKIGASMVRTNLHAVLKHETPFYRLQVTSRKVAASLHEVTDQGVIYGAWLEGTGSRNFPRTRFRGYATFRRTTQQLDRRAGVIADYTVREYLPGMG